MPDHERDCGALLLGERQELRRKLAHSVTVERHKVRDPETVEDRKQHQRIFGRLSKRLRSLDERVRSLDGRIGVRRRIAFDVHQSVRKRDLELDLFTSERARAR
jgi:hypothetical protein